jgi:hypothetical protein
MVRRGEGHSPAIRRWFKKLHASGLTPKFKVLEECLFGIDQAEQAWIDKGRRKKWPLLNCREGGIGGALSEQAKDRISQIGQAKWADPQYVARWEAATARKLGHASVDEWKAARAVREAEHQANIKRNQANMRLAAERKRERDAVRVPLTHNGIAFIHLRGGLRAVIDEQDWQRAIERNWYANRNGTRWRAVSKTNGRVFLHQFIAGRMWIKPANGNPLDCRRCNLIDSARRNYSNADLVQVA